MRKALSTWFSMRRMRSRSTFDRIGVRTSSRLWPAAPSGSSRLGRGPISETSDITSSSRIGSIGGLVTCAKHCLK